jgi:CheY-like chemotaxis protein
VRAECAHTNLTESRKVPTLISGRKLLLADDSIAIQKVVDLTFTDEGMEVTTVGDGQDALEKLNQFTPDVVLADVFMPGVDGYELCKFIKESERFRGIPVMLLIGTFEPFDEAEAQRVGADDVVTKPFQSIRQLVSRVGSLLGDETAAQKETAQKYSTLGLEQAESTASVAEVPDTDEHENVRVFVEAPIREEIESTTEHSCPPSIDIQTADTQQLEPIDSAAIQFAQQTDIADTLEIEVVPRTEFEVSLPASAKFDDSVLDLGDVDNFASGAADEDFILDLDDETETAPLPPLVAEVADSPQAIKESPMSAESAVLNEPSLPETDDWMVSRAVHHEITEVSEVSAQEDLVEASQVNPGDLSPDAIDAISRRVVEQLSEKVVREIAWEVVPELSELLIKKRLEEQK